MILSCKYYLYCIDILSYSKSAFENLWQNLNVHVYVPKIRSTAWILPFNRYFYYVGNVAMVTQRNCLQAIISWANAHDFLWFVHDYWQSHLHDEANINVYLHDGLCGIGLKFCIKSIKISRLLTKFWLMSSHTERYQIFNIMHIYL